MSSPNFTGAWIFNPSRSSLQITAPDWTILEIEHRDPYFRMTRTHTVGETTDRVSLELTTDGREIRSEQAGVKLVGRIFWEGDSLVFEAMLSRAGVEGSNVVRYELSEGGDDITATERFRGEGSGYENVWVLEKI